MVLAKALSEANIVVQDRPKVIQEAKKVCVIFVFISIDVTAHSIGNKNPPEAVNSGRVILECAWSAVPRTSTEIDLLRST